MEWVKVSERSPEQKDKSYQVVAVSSKVYESGNYAGEKKKTIVQDWVVRNWPQNFTHWLLLPPVE